VAIGAAGAVLASLQTGSRSRLRICGSSRAFHFVTRGPKETEGKDAKLQISANCTQRKRLNRSHISGSGRRSPRQRIIGPFS